MIQSHKDHPEIWLRPSPKLPLEVLSTLVESRCITATPRLGARNGDHPKGYEPGQVATLRVLDDTGAEHLSRMVRIESIVIRPLQELTPGDLENTFPYKVWEEVRSDFSLFEKRQIDYSEQASIVEFSYL